MSSLPTEISSLLIPMQGRPWLVPNIVVAEVIPLRQPDRPGHGPEWLLGWLSWRDQSIPLVSFERLNESGQITIGQDARIAVLNTVAGKRPFYAVIVQGIPRLIKVGKDDPVEEPVETGAAESMYIQVAGDLAVIPDLDAIEGAVSGLQT
ncbi:chemotaxis protein CheW [Alcanivorax sp. DP30]|uniref:chemotaxis protein CheW n=1 Tax=Alcanivorax sp. DP30 TaxID=2606217 RepID=UPI00136E8747|nr:chemotaxis protein CheW [Alcanivorax sp. DP30]MZR63154.1 chemotaxis protein CheW [Alcanivorax sp. DP30]